MDAQHLIPLSAFDPLGDAVAVADSHGKVVYVNRAFIDTFGMTADQLASANTGSSAGISTALQKVLTPSSASWNGSVSGPNGSVMSISISASPVCGKDGKLTHMLAVARGGGMHDSAGFLNKDPLTGLPTRSFLQDRIEHTVQTHKRHGGSVVLIILGLDHFTLVNDALGLAVGDILLATAADRIRTCIRESDSAFRLDGDKFGILMTVTAPDDVIIVAEKILSTMREPYNIDGQEVLITSSLGIGAYPGDSDDQHQLIQLTENALHHAKQAGRDQYQFLSKDMNGKALNRFNLASRIRKAIANDEFTVYYQPKVRSDDHSILGAEALARWQDPELGLILPADFIPIAEETGLIESMGRRIFEICCQQGKKWMDAGYDPITLSVNISPRQFRNSKLVETISGILSSTGLPASWLELEITESTIMHDMEGSVRKMTALREMGLGLSIDDFGTGYSSLSYLSSFPLTALKIDKAFVSDINTNPKTAEITRAIIGLSKGLKLDVIAEGCEISEDLKFLKDHGCDAVQGFYFSRAVPAHEFEAMLRAGMVYPVPSSTDMIFP